MEKYSIVEVKLDKKELEFINDISSRSGICFHSIVRYAVDVMLEKNKDALQS